MAVIVIYDSGVGGLSVYQEVAAKCAEHDYVFVSDNEAFPYGTKPEAALIERVLNVTQRLSEACQPDILVIACNTASTVALPLLRERFDFAIVGVVPAIKPAAQISHTKSIALLATPATVARPYTDSLINEFASDCDVLRIGSSELVQLAEDKLLGRRVELAQVGAILNPLFATDDVDTLILACTHFPLLIEEIEHLIKSHGRAISVVDSGCAIANRVAALLQAGQVSESGAGRSAMFTRSIDDSLPQNLSLKGSLRKLGFTDLQTLSV